MNNQTTVGQIEGSINGMQEHKIPVYLSPRQKKILMEALDALIGDKANTERITWATESEKKQLTYVRTEFNRCFMQR